MPAIIERYLLREILPPFAVSLLAFTSLVFSGRLMRLTQMVVGKGIGLMEILKACLFLLPYLLVFTVPMAATVGIILALLRLSADYEVVALKTAGLSFGQLVRPLVLFAVGVTLVTGLLTVYISPQGQKATRGLLTAVLTHRADLGIKEQTFNTDFDGLTMYVNQVTSPAGSLKGVFIHDFRELDHPLSVYAEKGRVEFDPGRETVLLTLSDGWIIRWGREPDRWHTIEFKTYQLPLEVYSLAVKGGKSEGEMSLGDLWAALGGAAPGSEPYNRLVVELSQRFSLPVGALLLCLLAVPLGLSSGPRGRPFGLIVGLLLFLVYYVVFTASWRLAVTASIPPALAPWLANLLFLAATPYFWWCMVKERPLWPGSWRRYLRPDLLSRRDRE